LVVKNEFIIKPVAVPEGYGKLYFSMKRFLKGRRKNIPMSETQYI